MLTFYHAPQVPVRPGPLAAARRSAPRSTSSRSTSAARNGSGAPHPKNPHPHGKVPALVQRRRADHRDAGDPALPDRPVPGGGPGPRIGEPAARGLPDLAGLLRQRDEAGLHPWMVCGLGDNPVRRRPSAAWPRSEARLTAAHCATSPYLVGDRFSAADLLICSPYLYFPDSVSRRPAGPRLLARCTERPGLFAGP